MMTLAVRSIIPTFTFISPSTFRFPFSTFSQLDLQRQPRLDLPPSTSFQPSCRQSNRKHYGAADEDRFDLNQTFGRQSSDGRRFSYTSRPPFPPSVSRP